VLLHALCAVRSQRPVSLRAIHVDHGLHRDSVEWGRHCERICQALAVPFEARRVSVTTIAEEGVEAAARRARYSAFAAGLRPGECLVTAQHRDDQAETLLLQLLRGAGVAGLAAMPGRALFAGGEILRPLLDYPRRSLEDYARQHGLLWVEDPSNQDLRLRRNFLRTEILPRLGSHWPEARRTLARVAGHMSDAQELLSEMADGDLACCRHPAAVDSLEALSAEATRRLTPARQRNLLRHWLRRQGYRMPDSHRLDELLRNIAGDSRRRQACLGWPGVEVWRYRDAVVAVPERARPDPSLDAAWNPDAPIVVPGIGKLSVEPIRGAGVAPHRLTSARLQVRLRRGGETVRLPGRGHHHAVKKLLQAAGVPPWERARLPMLYCGSELVAIADRWVSASCAAHAGEPGWRIIWEPFAEA
jgi:tRNA(Ile)-lysidine synthase